MKIVFWVSGKLKSNTNPYNITRNNTWRQLNVAGDPDQALSSTSPPTPPETQTAHSAEAVCLLLEWA